PIIHFRGHRLSDGQERILSSEPKPEAALIVERHRRDLPERVLAVEHPAVGPREERVGYVAQVHFDRGTGARGRAGALHPLAQKVGRNRRALELAVARLPGGQPGGQEDRIAVEKIDASSVARASSPPLDTLPHDPLAIAIETLQRLAGVERP